MTLAICIPARGRKSYLDILLQRLPPYLDMQWADWRIYVAEQEDNGPYNVGLSRNMAAKVAIDDGCDFLIFQNVDTVPKVGVDYRPEVGNAMWFMAAGGARIRTEDFEKVNGWPNDYIGWGHEDTEFFHRWTTILGRVPRWDTLSGVHAAIIWDLELEPSWDNRMYSCRYWGSATAPLYEAWPEPLQRPAKSWFTNELSTANARRCDRVHAMAMQEKLAWFAANGLAQANYAARVRRCDCITIVGFSTL